MIVPSIVIDQKEFREMPYNTTKVSWGRTKGQIDGLLYEYGVKNKAWVTKGEEEVLYFELDVEIRGVERKIAFKFEPTMIRVRKRNRQRETLIVVEKNTSWRLFWWHLKGKLEAVKYGLVSMEEELMSNIIHRLPDGSETTLGQSLKGIIVEDRLDTLALEDKRGVKIIDVEMVSK